MLVEKKKVVIRADASSLLGVGHIMRCLTIASALKDEGYSVTFIMSDIEGNLAGLAKSRGFDVFMVNTGLDIGTVKCELSAWNEGLQESDSGQCIRILQDLDTVDILVVDHYCLDKRWEIALSAYVGKIVVIDDLANRFHACDILLDQNYFKNMTERYHGLIGEGCKLLLGSEYSLLDAKYRSLAGTVRDFSKGISRVLIFFGGADPDNVTMTALRGLVPVTGEHVNLDVIIGASNRHADELFNYCEVLSNVSVFQSVANMHEFIANADIAFGAGGVSTWERCISGLPTFTVSIAENQVQTSHDLDSMNAIIYLGDASTVSEKDFSDAYTRASESPGELEKISINATAIMGANAGKSRIALLEYL